MNNIFVNEAINLGIENYINKTAENDFITIIIKSLIIIYGDLDIVNPFKTKNENGMGGLDANLSKYGYSKDKISIFKQNVLNFYLTQNEKPNKYFNQIEKNLIDMYFYKLASITVECNDDFYNSLLIDGTELNNIYSTNKKEIRKYYTFKQKVLNTKIEFIKLESNTLTQEAYELAGYSYDNIVNINEAELARINSKVFEFFQINEADENRFVRLEQAIAYHKEFSIQKEEVDNHGKEGKVEFILLMGFISISIIIMLVTVGILVR